MTDLVAALTLLGAPAAVLLAVRCAIQRQFRRRSERPQLVGGSYGTSGWSRCQSICCSATLR